MRLDRGLGPTAGTTLMTGIAGLGLLTSMACTDTDPRADSGAAFTVFDSAGVEVVISHRAAWSEGGQLVLDANPLWEVGAPGTSELFGVAGAVRVSDGRVAILEGGTSRILVFDGEGNPTIAFGGAGEGPGELSGPAQLIAVGADSLLVQEVFGGRISRFSIDGGFGGSTPNVVARGWILAGASAERDAILTTTARLLRPRSLDEPGRDGTGREYLAAALRSDGMLDTLLTRTLPPDPFSADDRRVLRTLIDPGAWLSTASGTAVFGRGGLWPLEVFGPEWRVERRIRLDGEATMLSDDMVRGHLAGLYPTAPEAASEVLAGTPSLPTGAAVPVWEKFTLDGVGRLWVRPFVLGTLPEPGSQGHRFGSMSYADPVAWMVFDPSGFLLGTVEIPPRVRPLDIGEDWVLALRRDELDVEHVGLYRLRPSG